MEGDKTYQDSYKAIQKAMKENVTGSVTINYNKFDERTASEIRLALSRALGKRKREVYQVISGTKNSD